MKRGRMVWISNMCRGILIAENPTTYEVLPLEGYADHQKGQTFTYQKFLITYRQIVPIKSPITIYP